VDTQCLQKRTLDWEEDVDKIAVRTGLECPRSPSKVPGERVGFGWRSTKGSVSFHMRFPWFRRWFGLFRCSFPFRKPFRRFGEERGGTWNGSGWVDRGPHSRDW